MSVPSVVSRAIAVLAFAGALLSAGAVQASTIAINFTDTIGQTLLNPPFTLGWSFTPLTDIVVTDLGLFDSDQDGLTDRYEIGLWDSGANLLVSTILPSGTSAPLDDKFRFQAVTPTNLQAGQTYVIGALFASGNDGLFFPETPISGFSATGITFLAPMFDFSGPLAFPGTVAGTQDQPSYFGPNFKYESDAAPVPEPATLLLLGAGLVPLARRRAVRRNRQ